VKKPSHPKESGFAATAREAPFAGNYRVVQTAREIGGPNFAGAPPAAQVVIVLRYFRLSGQGSDFRLPDVINYFTPVRQTGRDEVTVLAVQMLAAPS
jgi:hypothetical protein